MKRILIVVASLLLLVLSGCGTYSQSVQVDDHAYLLLTGNPEGNVVVIDDGKPIDLSKETKSFVLNGQQATKIKIPIGKHTVKVAKNGVLMINRVFYVSSGNSFEVEL
jgi:hypothetical protein